MIPLEDISSLIMNGMGAASDLEFHEVVDPEDQTDYLVLEYSSAMQHRGQPIVEYGDGVMRETETVGLTLTIYSHSPYKLSRIVHALKAREWLDKSGRLKLKDQLDCVLVHAGPVITRDYQEMDIMPWIRREGFDAEFRILQVTEIQVDMMDTTH